MHYLPRITFTIILAVGLCLQGFALPIRPRPPVPRPPRPNNSHLLQSAAAAKSLLLSRQNANKAALLRSAANSNKSKLLSARNAGKAALLLSKNAGKAALLQSAANSGKSKLLSALNSHKAALLLSKNAGKAALLQSAANSGKAKLLSALNSHKAALLSSKNAGKAALLKSASNSGKAKLLTALNSHKSALLGSRNSGKAALLSSARKRNRRNNPLVYRSNNYVHIASVKKPNTAGQKLSLASRAAAAASVQHALLQQAKRSMHNFKTAQHNAGPNVENQFLLLQQQKQTARFRHSLIGNQGNDIQVGNRGSRSAIGIGVAVRFGAARFDGPAVPAGGLHGSGEVDSPPLDLRDPLNPDPAPPKVPSGR